MTFEEAWEKYAYGLKEPKTPFFQEHQRTARHFWQAATGRAAVITYDEVRRTMNDWVRDFIAKGIAKGIAQKIRDKQPQG